jgi:hypothetical protein
MFQGLTNSGCNNNQVMLLADYVISIAISWVPAMDNIERIERRLKLHDVRVLLSVVQAGSMHKAAERLATFRRKIAVGAPESGIAAFAENCKVGRI